jgi:Tfp pilus assembly protein FimT
MALTRCHYGSTQDQRSLRLFGGQLPAGSGQLFSSLLPFNRRGTTILELALSLSVISVLSAIAYPRIGRLLDGIHVRGTATEIHSLFTTARHNAITRAERVTVQIDTARAVISLVAGSDTLRARGFSETHGVALSANRASFTYSPIGIGHGAGNMTLVIRRNARVDSLFISRLGRVRRD